MPMPTVLQMIHFLESNQIMFISSIYDKNGNSWIVNGREKKEDEYFLPGRKSRQRRVLVMKRGMSDVFLFFMNFVMFSF